MNLVKVLLERGSPLDIKDKIYDETPLGWVLYGWAHPPETSDGRFYEVVALLVAAGATVKPECLATKAPAESLHPPQPVHWASQRLRVSPHVRPQVAHVGDTPSHGT